MYEINYEAFDITSLEGSDGPVAYSGKDYPLRDLEHRKFEKLLYSLYKEEINNKQFPFDDIQLMNGVRDDGKDCALYNDGTLTGIIQCKHSEKESKPTLERCVKEIVKFVLYSIKDKNLIPDLNSFTYHFASSSGFSKNVEAYLRAFSTKISKEKNLQEWTTLVIKNSTSLSGFKYHEVEVELLQKLKQLTIKTIVPHDIQILLAKYELTIVKYFFTVRLIPDIESTKSIKTDIEEIKHTLKSKPPSVKKILEEFQQESNFLANYKSSFSLNNPMQIDREIAAIILGWLIGTLKDKEENVAILKGGAGSGKSAILNKVYRSLLADGIPTIAIKADIKSADSIRDLEEKLNLSTSLEASVQTLLTTYQRVVVIIDQLDALSQTLSAKRDNLATYITLIERFKNISGVRIIISVREYDLNYDPYLRPLSKHTSFDAGFLTETEVNQVLKSLQVTTCTPQLLRLLSTPLHLELFCQVYDHKEKNIRFFSLYELYNELWLVKIDKRGQQFSVDKVRGTLYQIANKIYQRQGNLTVSMMNLDASIVDYLTTEGLLLKTNGSRDLVFFHQTFYDYVFARAFVENGKDVIEYLNENSQGLFVRSSLKIILSHLREQNPTYYKEIIIKLLNGPKIRFHIKHLVLNYLGFVEDPLGIEKEIAERNIIGSPHETVFYESINTSNWVKYFIEMDWLVHYIDGVDEQSISTIFQLMLRNNVSSNTPILEFLSTLDNDPKHEDLIARYLCCSRKWNNTATALFERTKAIIISSPYNFCQCMELALEVDQDWVYFEFEQILLSRTEFLDAYNHDFLIDHSEIELLKKLFQHNPEKTFYLCQNIIETIISKTQREGNEDSLIEDGAFYFFSRGNKHHGDDDEFYQIYVEAIEEYSQKKDVIFEKLIRRYSDSKSASLLRILVYGFLANPKDFYEHALQTLKYIFSRSGFRNYEKLEYCCREVIAAIYSLLSYNQKQELNSLLLTIKDKTEISVFTHPLTQKKSRHNWLGYQQYLFLSVLPRAEVVIFPDLKRRFLELERRFGKLKDSEPNKITTRGVPAPYQKDTYLKMSLQDWKNSFLKYGENWKDNSFSSRGGIVQHGRVFEEEVSNRPDFFYPFLEENISNSEIYADYKVYGINGLIKAKYKSDLVRNLITRQLNNELSDSNILSTIWSIDYLVNNNKVNEEIISFLCKQAITNKNPEKDDLTNPKQRSINSVRGAALDRLMKINDSRFSNKIFAVINKAITNEKTIVVKATIAGNSAYLLNVNPDKAFNIFKKVTKSDKRLVSEAMWSANYFARRYFNRMIYFIDLALKEKAAYKDLANLLAGAWLRGIPESEGYLFKLLHRSTAAKAEIIRIAVHPENLIEKDGTLDTKCMQLFQYCLNKKDKEVIHQYSIGFLHFKPEMFESLFPLLKIYSSSKVFVESPAYFCKYIIKCCTKKTVYKCAELISSLDKLVKTNITMGNHYDSEPLNVILAIYNVLGNTSKDKELKNTCMNMFDKMLQQPQHRSAAQQITTLVEL